MLSFEEYNKLHGERFRGLPEEEIRRRHERDSIFAAFVIKMWLEERKKGDEPKA